MDTNQKHGTIDTNEVIQRLKAAGVTPTQQRVEIARMMFSRPQHLSAEQIMAMAKDEHRIVSKATVYNTLGLFARKGLVREVIVDPVKVFYDSNISPHQHFYNVDTGNLIDIDATQVRLENMTSPPEGTVTEGVDIIIRIRNENPAQ